MSLYGTMIKIRYINAPRMLTLTGCVDSIALVYYNQLLF